MSASIPPLPGTPVANADGPVPGLPNTRVRTDRDAPRGLGTPGGNPGMNTKWDTYQAFGLPAVVSSDMCRYLALRSGSTARAAIDQINTTCWQTDPALRRKPDGDMDPQEALLNDVMKRLWHRVHDGDWRALTGRYSALILKLADGAALSEPVTPGRIRNGVEALVDIVPVSDAFITAPEVVQDRNDPRYGEALYFLHRPQDANGRPLADQRVHPDRVLILSQDGTMRRRPFLEPVFNAIMNLDKLEGAVAEGAFKDSRMLLHFNIDTMAKLAGQGIGGLAVQTPIAGDPGGPSVSQVAQNIADQVDDMNSRYDNMVATKGVSGQVLRTQMRELAQSVWALRASVAAAMGIPMRILFGSQSGERATTEDFKAFHQSMDARRNNEIIPRLMELLDRLQRWGMLETSTWRVEWQSLTQSSVDEKQEMARIMVAANAQAFTLGQLAFSANEIRKELGYPPLDRKQVEEQEKMFAGLLEPKEEPIALPAPQTDAEAGQRSE